MKRIKQKEKIKEPVKLRVKSLANGNKSLYLDTYTNGKRTYEFLKLYLVPEITSEDKAANEATMRAASVIKAKRILEYVNGKAGIRRRSSILSLQDWIDNIIKVKVEKKSTSSKSLMKRLMNHLQRFNKSVLLHEVDREFCIGFSSYLRTATALNAPKPLKQATQFELLNALSIILNEAVRAEMIPSNPMQLLNSSERIKKPESIREYLSAQEVRSLIAVSKVHIEAGDDVSAFLFCCFCGLRYSDVRRLTWENIVNTENGKKIVMTMQKTRRRVEVPLSDMAASFLPEERSSKEAVFNFPRYDLTLRRLKKASLSAGIKKKSHSTYRDTLLPR